MLPLTIPGREFYDERTGQFFTSEATHITLEHSLRSMAAWESKWHKPFLGSTDKTLAECMDYVNCMSLDGDIDPVVLQCLTKKNFDTINAYIENPMTATTIREDRKQRPSREKITSEIIYYWMSALDIPFACENWHLNRLLMLIRVSNIKNGPAKMMSKKDIYSQNRALNAARKQRLGTHG